MTITHNSIFLQKLTFAWRLLTAHSIVVSTDNIVGFERDEEGRAVVNTRQSSWVWGPAKTLDEQVDQIKRTIVSMPKIGD